MMNNNNNTQSGERLSFYKLFCEKGYRISIPIIQRDYAQGRDTESEVRNVFLDALSDYLNENKPNRDLDFVYGILSKTGGSTDFVPLDGQQRLTTLFLLHWYLCQISDNTEGKAAFKSFLFKDGKSMFTYETRSSSSEFCDAFMNNDIDFENLIENSLSKTIENSPWFFLSWKNDPTIKSMLTMLDAIHSKFADKEEYFERLLDTENPIITFLFLNLKDFKLTDDLYIKMNSRGKSLTSFENLKAKYEQYLESVQTDRKFKKSFNGGEKEVSLKEYFSYNIDTKWANLFWNYRELVGDKNTYDEEMKNFIRVIFTNHYAVSNEADENLEFLLGTQVARKRIGYNDNISYYKYKELQVIFDKTDTEKITKRINEEGNKEEKDKLEKEKIRSIVFSKNSTLNLIDAFESLVNGNNKIKTYLSKGYKFYFNENSVFENALKHSLALPERIMFHAYVRFLIVFKNDQTGIEQWMRVIHNLANNTIIDGAEELSRAIKSIEKLLPKSNDILKYLCENSQIDSFSTWQVKEEKIKAHLIIKSVDWKELIENTEKHDFFDGQIGFVLEFSGIVEYYDTNHSCNWKEQEDKVYFNSFKIYAKKAVAVFKDKDSYNSEYIWERAVLTKGIYALDSRQNTVTTENRFNLLHTNTTQNNISRDYSWKRLLRIGENYDKRQYIKEVFDDKNFNENNLIQSLQTIRSESKVNDWRNYFISYPELMEYCLKGFIKVDDPNTIFLLRSIYCGANQYFAEMYSYYLWKKFIEPNIENYYPFNNGYYHEVKSNEELACIVLNDFCHNRIHYEINIYSWSNDELPNQYDIVFRKSKGENMPEKYGDDIKGILKNLGFVWSEHYDYCFIKTEDSNSVQKQLDKLIEGIQKL
jgi:hypothetical protein